MNDLNTWLRAQLDAKEREATEFLARGTHQLVAERLYREQLAEVQAKRRLLDYLVDLEDKALDGNWWNLDTYEPIQLLALPYANQPGYREEWRPEEATPS